MMVDDPQGLVKKFGRDVPEAAQTAIFRAVELAYRTADELVRKELHEAMWDQSWGYFRWLKLDSELLSVGERFGHVSRFEKNTDQTHIGHTELHFGDLILTAAMVPVRGRKPRAAAYREFLAESNQLQLFEERRRNQEKGKLWAVILHVPNVSGRTPLHVDVGFFAQDNTLAAPLVHLKERVEAMEPAIVQATLKQRRGRDIAG